MRIFEWDDYRKFASELAQCDEKSYLAEARLRTAVSRAYYSQFLRARYLFGSPEQPHLNLIKHLQDSNTRLIKSVGLKLKTLHDLRIQADYEELFPHPKDAAEQAIDIADDIFSTLNILDSK